MEALKNILKYLLENYPIAIWIAVGGAVTFLFFSIKDKVKVAKTKAENALDKIDNLECDKHWNLIDE